LSNPDSPNGNPLKNAPLWAQILFFWGPLTGMACFLVYMLAKDLPDTKLSVTLLRTEVQALTKAINDLTVKVSEQTAVSRAQCVAIARTEIDKKECLIAR